MSESTSVSLDLESEHFDALQTLTSPENEVRVPIPNAKIFNNLDEYRKKSFGKAVDLQHSQQSTSKIVIERKFDASMMCSTSRREWKEPPNVLTKMNQLIGPLSLLNKCLNRRVKILVRRRRRTEYPDERYFWLTATLIVFDKHCNLVLHDVDEVMKSNDECRERHFNKLFVRGDNVILVSLP